jgi:hypothetical protein
MPSHFHSNMVNLILCFSIRKCPSKFKSLIWEHCTFNSQIFECGKIYYSNFIILTFSFKLSFSLVGLEISFLLSLVLISLNEIVICYLLNLSNTPSYFWQKVSLTDHQFCPLLRHECSVTSQYFVQQPFTNKLIPPNCWYESLIHTKFYLLGSDSLGISDIKSRQHTETADYWDQISED